VKVKDDNLACPDRKVKILNKKDEKILIKKCKEVDATLLQAKMAGILYKTNGLEQALIFLDDITQRGSAVIN